MRRTTWSKVQNDEAKKLWKDGVHARHIGERVGKSRFAVIGRADREGWGVHPLRLASGWKQPRHGLPAHAFRAGNDR